MKKKSSPIMIACLLFFNTLSLVLANVSVEINIDHFSLLELEHIYIDQRENSFAVSKAKEALEKKRDTATTETEKKQIEDILSGKRVFTVEYQEVTEEEYQKNLQKELEKIPETTLTEVPPLPPENERMPFDENTGTVRDIKTLIESEAPNNAISQNPSLEKSTVESGALAGGTNITQTSHHTIEEIDTDPLDKKIKTTKTSPPAQAIPTSSTGWQKGETAKAVEASSKEVNSKSYTYSNNKVKKVLTEEKDEKLSNTDKENATSTNNSLTIAWRGNEDLPLYYAINDSNKKSVNINAFPQGTDQTNFKINIEKSYKEILVVPLDRHLSPYIQNTDQSISKHFLTFPSIKKDQLKLWGTLPSSPCGTEENSSLKLFIDQQEISLNKLFSNSISNQIEKTPLRMTNLPKYVVGIKVDKVKTSKTGDDFFIHFQKSDLGRWHQLEFHLSASHCLNQE